MKFARLREEAWRHRKIHCSTFGASLQHGACEVYPYFDPGVHLNPGSTDRLGVAGFTALSAEGAFFLQFLEPLWHPNQQGIRQSKPYNWPSLVKSFVSTHFPCYFGRRILRCIWLMWPGTRGSVQLEKMVGWMHLLLFRPVSRMQHHSAILVCVLAWYLKGL